MGFIFPMLAVLGISLAFVIWAVVSRRWPVGRRRVTMAVAIVAACLIWTLVSASPVLIDDMVIVAAADVEPPGTGRRRLARSQWRGDSGIRLETDRRATSSAGQ